MRWTRSALEVRGAWRGMLPSSGPGVHTLGPFEITVREASPGSSLEWSVANRSDQAVAVRSVALVHELAAGVGLRMFSNGYQSWSEASVRRWGVDADPSRTDGSIGLLRSIHHADRTVAPPGAIRAESVAVIADDSDTRLLVGFDGGREHDGTIWLRRGEGKADVELVVEAHLGGAVLGPGAERQLHGVTMVEGPDASALLESWAHQVGATEHARTDAPYQVGWCSWYHYFHAVTERDLRDNLALAGSWPFDVFQLDDGFQSAVGDWLSTNDRFPSDLSSMAGDIAAAGLRPGLWLAPFLVAPDSEVARQHPEWVARHRNGNQLVGNVNPEWGGLVWTLDTTNHEVVEHLEQVSSALVEAGFTYLKLDFTYAPAIEGVYRDPSRTPAQRVRAGFDAIRRGAGDDAFLLGCGAPLGCTVGAVDGMRIGPDVAPAWDVESGFPGYEPTAPSTRNAWRNTLARSFMHRNLWLNDPDCLMLRTAQTRLSPAAVEAWARAVGVSGGMAIVSDDLSLLDHQSRRLLLEVIDLGREADREALVGRPPRCGDLLDHEVPAVLTAGKVALTADPSVPESSLRRR